MGGYFLVYSTTFPHYEKYVFTTSGGGGGGGLLFWFIRKYYIPKMILLRISEKLP